MGCPMATTRAGVPTGGIDEFFDHSCGEDNSRERQSTLEHARDNMHPHCVVCGTPSGPRLRFKVLEDESVEGVFNRGGAFQGYSGILHGGVIATLLDAAMTHCLFAQNRVAVTAELLVRYHQPVIAESGCVIRARVARHWGPLFSLRAELIQEGEVRVTGTGKFMETTVPHPAAHSLSLVPRDAARP
jgi:uncharacterized protein (TIGR00369 family)